MSKLGQVNILIHDIILSHLLGVNVENLASAMLVGERDFHVHFQTTGTQQSLINHVHSIGHTNQQDVVQLVHTIEF